MNREERIIYLIEKGYKYDKNTGIIVNKNNRIVNGSPGKGYRYLSFSIKNKTYFVGAHQFAFYYVYKKVVEQIDHINGIRDDNRIENLRGVNSQQNHFNNTKVKGYTYSEKRNKFFAKIKLNGKTIYIGSYNNEVDARKAYLDAKKIYHII